MAARPLLHRLTRAYHPAPVDVELARQQWEHGYRRVEEARGTRREYDRLFAQVEAVTAALRQRVGQTFSLDELARAYDGADIWARDAVEDTGEPGAGREVSTVTDAAFHLYARGATDYAP